jgi:outer membrane protein assembly factor BamB
MIDELFDFLQRKIGTEGTALGSRFQPRWVMASLVLLALGLGGCEPRGHSVEASDTRTANAGVENRAAPYFKDQPQTISLDLPAPAVPDGSGGLVAADLTGDGQREFLITQSGYVGAYRQNGQKLWDRQVDIQVTWQAETQGLPGLHGPGVQVVDGDGNGGVAVVFLTRDRTLQIVDGQTGKLKRQLQLQPPQGAERWEHLVVANFRGQGRRDLLLQATNTEGYRLGRYLATYRFEDLLQQDNPQPLWTRDDFQGAAHNGARVADLNGDGRDEVLGGTIISPDGQLLFALPVPRNVKNPHLDGIYVADVRPDIPGLEVVALEEGGRYRWFGEVQGGLRQKVARVANRLTNGRLLQQNRVFLYNRDRLIWETHFGYQEPQNAAIANFDPARPGLEIWIRSGYDVEQKPFVFDAQGQLISDYVLQEVQPEGWAEKGVEVIWPIAWTGESRTLTAAKERHTAGEVAVFDPLTGKFLQRFREEADRLYVADVTGDWREELVVLNGNQLRIYENPAPNPNPNQPSLWSQNHYQRSKMTWNYYSP